MSDDELAFYVVWQPSGGAPTMQHATKTLATAEAKRLAQRHPGRRFYVLRAALFVENVSTRTVELKNAESLPGAHFHRDTEEG